MTTTPLPNTATGNQLPSTVKKPATASMNPSDFINMMITQLQNQDPMQPTDSNALLQQMSAIGQMQASSDLQTTLQSLTLQNQIGAASSLIGKSVVGQDSNGNVLTGLVNSVQVTQSGVSLQLDSGKSLDLSNLTAIAPAPGTATTATTH
ncbi:MAG TPA: flagellar hook capping FlgD N-terminal domain-containing protein [Humisphaera sp.]|jgi:flagellar basal-body rod modification protein FlgD|nr:flagellar hook capping FlgD N-terminal domain-containing protein [Humisphaera sp.]